MKTKYGIKKILFVFLFSISPILQAQENSKLFTKEERVEFVEKAGKLLNDNYVFPEVATKIEKYLKDKLTAGAYDNLTDVKEFANVMTKEVQSISNDKHMRVFVRRIPAPMSSEQLNPLVQNYERRINLEKINYGFTKVEKMEDNIGYLELIGFPPLSQAKEYADLAMKFLSTSDALIIDLRRNGGGNPDLIQYVCSYLFEKPTHINSIYSRKTNQTTDYITFEKVNGKKMADLTVFVLTSKRTFSGGEEFAYDIQTQKRGTLIGEVTGGGANPGGTIPVTANLAIFIPDGRAINPITKTNWEGVGVIPEIKCEADKALETALPLARKAAKAHRDAVNKIIYKQTEEIGSNIDKAGKLFDEKKNNEAEKLIEITLDQGLTNDLINENAINQFGYDKLGIKNYSMAISIFKYNVKAFPNSANVYDSLGEAYMKAGNNQLAIKNYEKSLELDPNSKSSKEALKQLKGNK